MSRSNLCALVFGLSIVQALSGCQPASSPQETEPVAVAPAEKPVPETSPDLGLPDFVEAVDEGFGVLELDDFQVFPADVSHWSVEQNVIVCQGKDQPRGYIYTKRPYKDFALRFDVRFPRPEGLTDDRNFEGNTGCLVYMTGENKIWPVCLEVQGKYIDTAAIKVNGRKDLEVITHEDAEARWQALKPVGEWNSFEIVSRGGALTAKVNGVTLCTSEPTELVSGPIGFQSEGHDVYFRNIRIQAD